MMTPVENDWTKPECEEKAEQMPETFSGQVGENGKLEEKREQLIEKARSLFAEGRRHYLCRNYQEATDSLNEACQLYCKLYGDMALESADVYFYYGKSLVELERITQSIIAVKGDNAAEEAGSSDEDEDGDEEMVNDGALEEQENEPKKNKESDVAEVVVVENVDLKQEDTQMLSESETVITSAQNGSGGDDDRVTVILEKIEEIGDSEAQELDVAGCSSAPCLAAEDNADNNSEGEKASNLADAWEMLDLARVIYEKTLTEMKQDNVDAARAAEETKRHTLRLSEVRMALGEACTLDEKYAEAVDEFLAAQEILKPTCAPDDRRLAEIFFQIGSVSEMDGKYEQAFVNIDRAAKLLELRKQNLQDQLAQNEKGDGVEEIRNEIDGLAELLMDIYERLVDLAESQKNSEIVKENLQELAHKVPEMKSYVELGEVGQGNNGHSYHVTDVSNLVRKPLKRSSDDQVEQNESKKTKLEEKSEAETTAVEKLKQSAIAMPEIGEIKLNCALVQVNGSKETESENVTMESASTT